MTARSQYRINKGYVVFCVLSCLICIGYQLSTDFKIRRSEKDSVLLGETNWVEWLLLAILETISSLVLIRSIVNFNTVLKNKEEYGVSGS